MAVKKIELVDYGICQIGEDTTKEDSDDSPTGYFLCTDEIQFLETTDSIELRAGSCFGISYRFVTDSGEVEVVAAAYSICHPPLTHPLTNERFVETIKRKRIQSNEMRETSYLDKK